MVIKIKKKNYQSKNDLLVLIAFKQCVADAETKQTYLYIVFKDGVPVGIFSSKADALRFKRKLELELEQEEKEKLKKKPTTKRSR